LAGRRLDIVVVNAGILRRGSVETVSLEDLDRMLDVNVRGVLFRRPRLGSPMAVA
jgi:NADP-dependent 3-hydroxy acid dehydrogenase YdfG